MVCTYSPQKRPIIDIVDINTLTIEQTLDISGRFIDIVDPLWIIASGLDKNIYVLVNNPEATIPDLPQIDEETEEIILVYDVVTDVWSYQIKPMENTFEILGVLPDNGGIFFQNYTPDGREIIQFSSDFQILRKFGLDLGYFQGITLDGSVFFSNGTDYADILVDNVSNYPLLIPPVPQK